MTVPTILAIDQGTTGTTVLVVGLDGVVRGRGYREHPQHFPRLGWVEHDPLAIWQTVVDCSRDAMAAAGVSADGIGAIGITNQRETVVAWDASTGSPVGPTIVWQDRRTSATCEQLRQEGFDRTIRQLTGLPTDPYFSATKIAWLLDNDEDVQAAASAGTLRIGTIDSWLVWNLSGARAHVTDASNAARTMLYDIHRGEWSAGLCARFGVDVRWLPRVVDSAGICATCDPGVLLGIEAPISGIAGDQQAALFGQACFREGQAKATYGTGAFILVNSGDRAPVTDALISTIAWRIDGSVTYALEGSVFTAGASVQWLRDGLKVIQSASEVEPLASSVEDSGGVVVVPAFAGYGAPAWDPECRAAIMGISRGTTSAHIARATLEAVAFRVCELADAMAAEGARVSEMRVDGGMCANDLLLQMQADVLGIEVTRPVNIETTSIGAAWLAALGAGLVESTDAIAASWDVDCVVAPGSGASAMQDGFRRFTAAACAARQFGSAPVDASMTASTAG